MAEKVSQPPPNSMANSSPADSARPIRVLVVDDSAFMRFTISSHLATLPGIQVVGTAHDGNVALELIPKLHPDVVTLDVEMPKMDGLTTLREIMATNPCPVVMVSSLTTEGARETIQALTWGAVDFIAKPSTKANVDAIIDELAIKIRRAATARVYSIPKTRQMEIVPTSGNKRSPRVLGEHDKVILIGSSTGGPRALTTVIPALSGDLQAALIIVQHMPVGFTRTLAERLNSMSNIAIREAIPGDQPQVGLGLVAPGGFHMTLDENGRVSLNQNPPVHGVRPAIDVTLASVAQHYKAATICAILTGMGNDGTNGAALVHSAGGYVIAEDESSCVVWGMPRSVTEAGFANEIVPLPQMASAIQKAMQWN